MLGCLGFSLGRQLLCPCGKSVHLTVREVCMGSRAKGVLVKVDSGSVLTWPLLLLGWSRPMP